MAALNLSKIFASLSPKAVPLKALGLRVLGEIIGQAQDFWYDPPADMIGKPQHQAKKHAVDVPAAPAAVQGWSADRPQILQIIWGEGEVAPGGEYLNKMMVAPLGLQADHSVLDLAAGLGNFARLLAHKFNLYVTGMEADPQLAAAGMALSTHQGKAKHASVAPYDLVSFTAEKHYDVVIARELFFRVPDKKAFFTQLAKSLKPKGQVVFTDYVVEPTDRNQTPILEWLGFEAGAAPLAMEELKEALKAAGLDVRVMDDQTPFIHQEIVHALAKFAQFLRSHQPDEATRVLVKGEIELWARREAAIANGLKLVRCHAIATS